MFVTAQVQDPEEICIPKGPAHIPLGGADFEIVNTYHFGFHL